MRTQGTVALSRGGNFGDGHVHSGGGASRYAPGLAARQGRCRNIPGELDDAPTILRAPALTSVRRAQPNSSTKPANRGVTAEARADLCSTYSSVEMRDMRDKDKIGRNRNTEGRMSNVQVPVPSQRRSPTARRYMKG